MTTSFARGHNPELRSELRFRRQGSTEVGPVHLEFSKVLVRWSDADTVQESVMGRWFLPHANATRDERLKGGHGGLLMLMLFWGWVIGNTSRCYFFTLMVRLLL